MGCSSAGFCFEMRCCLFSEDAGQDNCGMNRAHELGGALG